MVAQRERSLTSRSNDSMSLPSGEDHDAGTSAFGASTGCILPWRVLQRGLLGRERSVRYRQLRALVLDPPAEGYEADLETAVRPGVSGSPLVFDAYEGSDSAEQRDEPDCSHVDETLALAIHDRYLAAVQAVDYVDDDPTADQLLSRARQVLQAQIDRL
jgi:hypothetical protein